MTKFKFSFDGKGINDKTSEYANRLATLTQEGLSKPGLGKLLELAPEMLELLKQCLHARQCNAPYGQTEKFPSVEAFKSVLNKIKAD